MKDNINNLIKDLKKQNGNLYSFIYDNQQMCIDLNEHNYSIYIYNNAEGGYNKIVDANLYTKLFNIITQSLLISN